MHQARLIIKIVQYFIELDTTLQNVSSEFYSS